MTKAPSSGSGANPDRQRPFLAVYCLLEVDNTLLIMQRKNTGYADSMWSVPSGHVDGDESVRSAASRELREETSLIVKPFEWSFHAVMHRKSHDRQVIDFFLKANQWQGSLQNVEPEKCSALMFVDLDSLPENFLPYVRLTIEPDMNHRLPPPSAFYEHGWE